MSNADEQAKRISVDIGKDVRKMGEFLRAAQEDRLMVLGLVRDPIDVFRRHGIDLPNYASPDFPVDQIIAEIRGIMAEIMSGDFLKRFRDIVEATSIFSSTSQSYEYNWDRGTHSDYKFESHTGTERGTFSESDTGSVQYTDQRFSGIYTNEFEHVLLGPLISDKVIQRITSQVEATLRHAAQTRHSLRLP